MIVTATTDANAELEICSGARSKRNGHYMDLPLSSKPTSSFEKSRLCDLGCSSIQETYGGSAHNHM